MPMSDAPMSPKGEEATTQRARASPEPILIVRNLVKHFQVGGGLFGGAPAVVKAVDGVSFQIQRGETLGLVGESGCGKTTTGRCILRLEPPTSGEVIFEGRDLAKLSDSELRGVRRRMQVIFQDPYSSLNPRMTVGQIIAEPLSVHGIVPDRTARAARVQDLLAPRGPAPGHGPPLPPRAVGGPAPAGGYRPGARHGAEPDRLRRAGLGPRRVDPGPDHQPAGGAPGASSG